MRGHELDEGDLDDDAFDGHVSTRAPQNAPFGWLEPGPWRTFVLLTESVAVVCPRLVPTAKMFWDAVPDPTGIQLTGTVDEVDTLLAWLGKERASENDEEIAAELAFAMEQVENFVEHDIRPPPSAWAWPGT